MLGVMGAGTAAALVAPKVSAAASPADRGSPRHGDVRVLVNGAPARVGSYAFPADVDTLVLDNGLVRFTFGRDDAAGGSVTGWSDVSITAKSVVVDGVELAHNLNGVDPRDPDRQHSFYVDAGGGKTRLVCSQVKVARVSRDLVDVAFIDTTSTPLQHEHHLIMRSGKRGLYGYDILTAVAPTSISEVRMNTRWDRSIFDHCYNVEHGSGQQPTYAYLATQTNIQDETWRVDGVNNPALPSPTSNSGNLPAGTVYTKYNWSLYHHENPFFGHYGNGFGAWLTPLGGVTEDTLCAFYGVGPQHQDLAIHQDALILNYFGANHYGLPSYPLPAGYRRLYGPWYSHITVSDSEHPERAIELAAAVAREEIEENRDGAAWIVDGLYPARSERTTVTGRLALTDGRPADGYWVVLSTQDVADVYTIHEPTYFVKTGADGRFRLPGIPPAWQPGTKTSGTYTLYAFASKGSATQQYKQTGIVVRGREQNLGEIRWTPGADRTFLWQIGKADRTAGEYALASLSPVRPAPRAYEKPAEIPGTLNFEIGTDWEPENWYYAQTNPGVWTISFELPRSYTGTATLTVSTAMQQGGRPTVAVNGNSADVLGTIPSNNDSTIARQADRSGYPRTAELTFPASLLRSGANTITLTHGAATAAGTGPGWDTLILEIAETAPGAPARLVGTAVPVIRHGSATTWRVTVRNTGRGEANDLRITGVGWRDARRGRSEAAPSVPGRDPNKFPVPVVASLGSGRSATAEITVDTAHAKGGIGTGLILEISANGGRARTVVAASPRH